MLACDTGANGMLTAGNRHLGAVIHAASGGYREPPLQPFFLERYAEAYIAEMRAFIELATGAPIDAPSGDDAMRSLELAEPIDLKRANGLTVELWFRLKDLAPGQRLLDG